MPKYTVIRDTQEKINRWDFDPVIDQHLPTGDYTLVGFENDFIIEKKHSTGEISNNIFDPAFEKELQRMEAFLYPFVICCFTLEDVFSFPFNSGIPQKYWPRLKINKGIMLKKINEFQLKYRVKWIFAGDHGIAVAEDLFKRIICLKEK